MSKVLKLEDIDDCGPTTARALKVADICSVSDLVASSANELMEATGWEREKCNNLINNARKLLTEENLLASDYITATEDLNLDEKRLRYSTGSEALNSLLKGGIESKALTEIYGRYGSGKTQITHTVSVLAQVDPERSGIIYLDTEGAFRSRRIQQICQARNIDPAPVLENIHMVRLYNAAKLEYHVKHLGQAIETFKACLVIVDSATNLHRVEYEGRGQLAERQIKLNWLMHKLHRIADVYNVPVIATNQIQDKPDTFFGDPTSPVGGNVVGHTSSYRLYVKQAGPNRSGTLIKSSWLPYDSCKFTVTDQGVVDVEDEKPKKKKGTDEEQGDD